MMQTTNFQDRASNPQNRSRVIGFILGSVVLAVFLGAYFAMHIEKEPSQALVADPQAETVTIPIEGMTCASCVAQVKKTLKSMDGVTGVEVSLAHRQAQVRYMDAKVSPERLAVAINDLGYKAGKPKIERAR